MVMTSGAGRTFFGIRRYPVTCLPLNGMLTISIGGSCSFANSANASSAWLYALTLPGEFSSGNRASM